MKLRRDTCAGGTTGSVMVMVLLFLTLTLFGVIVILGWTQSSCRLTERHNQYYRSVAAAEAATEKVLTRIAVDYHNQGESLVLANLATYRTLVPTTAEDGAWSRYEFKDPSGVLNRLYVQNLAPAAFQQLSSQYRGLYGYATTYRIISNVRERGGQFLAQAAVKQEISVATIPLFQFAIFYNLEMELNPGPNMRITGPVHCNTNIFLQPQAQLCFASDVTSGGDIILDKKPGDPLVRTPGTIIFEGEHDSRVSTLTLPIGTNSSSPIAVREVVEIPPGTESPTSPMGKERYYNKADMVILVDDAGVAVTSGRANGFATTVPAAEYSTWLKTNVAFFNKRENKTVKTTQIDVSQLRLWNESAGNPLRAILPGNGHIRTIYVADRRTQTSSTESGLRLVNGEELLPDGLTVATPNPLYIQGHYNVPVADRGTTNTANTKPASVIADAVSILSAGWNDANSTLGLSSRAAHDTTVNCALLAGIVPTVDGSYSGGVENFPRLLEDWSGRTFTYNGSMVVLFESRYATAPWQGTSGTVGIYNPPTRNWNFDAAFRDPARLPPSCPSVRAMIRAQWATIKPRSTI